MHEHKYLKGLVEGVRSPRVGITGRYELPNMGAENEDASSVRTMSHPCSPWNCQSFKSSLENSEIQLRTENTEAPSTSGSSALRADYLGL